MLEPSSPKVPTLIIAPSVLGSLKSQSEIPSSSSPATKTTEASMASTAPDPNSPIFDDDDPIHRAVENLKKRHKESVARLELEHTREMEEIQAKAELVLHQHGEKWKDEQATELQKLTVKYEATLNQMKQAQMNLVFEHNLEMGKLRAKYYDIKNQLKDCSKETTLAKEEANTTTTTTDDASTVVSAASTGTATNDGNITQHNAKMLILEKEHLREQVASQQHELELVRSQLADLAKKLTKEQQSHVRHMTAAKHDYMKQKRKFKKKLERLQDGRSLCSLQEGSVISDLTSFHISSSASIGSSRWGSNGNSKSSREAKRLMQNIVALAEKAKADDESYSKEIKSLKGELKLLKVSKSSLKKKLDQANRRNDDLTKELEKSKTTESELLQTVEELKATVRDLRRAPPDNRPEAPAVSQTQRQPGETTQIKKKRSLLARVFCRKPSSLGTRVEL